LDSAFPLDKPKLGAPKHLWRWVDDHKRGRWSEHGAKRSLGNQAPRSLSIAREQTISNIQPDYILVIGACIFIRQTLVCSTKYLWHLVDDH
jgi:hypothetical protein